MTGALPAAPHPPGAVSRNQARTRLIEMDFIKVANAPERPLNTLLIGFSGWADAAEGATSALKFPAAPPQVAEIRRVRPGGILRLLADAPHHHPHPGRAAAYPLAVQRILPPRRRRDGRRPDAVHGRGTQPALAYLFPRHRPVGPLLRRGNGGASGGAAGRRAAYPPGAAHRLGLPPRPVPVYGRSQHPLPPTTRGRRASARR